MNSTPIQNLVASGRSSLNNILTGGQSLVQQNLENFSQTVGSEFSNLGNQLTNQVNRLTRSPLSPRSPPPTRSPPTRSPPTRPPPTRSPPTRSPPTRSPVLSSYRSPRSSTFVQPRQPRPLRNQPIRVSSNPFTPTSTYPIRSYTSEYGPEYSDGNTMGGAVPYGSRYGYFVARPDRRNLGLGRGSFGGQSGGYGGYGGMVAKTNPYANQESTVLPETLEAQGTYNQLPAWHDMKGEFGTRQASFPIGGVELNQPSVISCKCEGSACSCIGPQGRLYDSSNSRPGTYDIGIPAYGDISQNKGEVGTEFTNQYGEGGYINGPDSYSGGGMLF